MDLSYGCTSCRRRLCWFLSQEISVVVCCFCVCVCVFVVIATTSSYLSLFILLVVVVRISNSSFSPPLLLFLVVDDGVSLLLLLLWLLSSFSLTHTHYPSLRPSVGCDGFSAKFDPSLKQKFRNETDIHTSICRRSNGKPNK